MKTSYMLLANPTNNTKLETCLFFTKCKCAICGKKFEADTQLYTWKRGTGDGPVYYCSYKCFRKWEKPHLEKNATAIRKAFKEAELYTPNGDKLFPVKHGPKPRRNNE